MSIESCPIVYPTNTEFNNFHAYVEHLEKTYSSRYGMVKVAFLFIQVVPPAGWKANSVGY